MSKCFDPDSPNWEREMEEYINGMSGEEFKQFLIDTEYEFYTSEPFQEMDKLYPDWITDLINK